MKIIMTLQMKADSGRETKQSGSKDAHWIFWLWGLSSWGQACLVPGVPAQSTEFRHPSQDGWDGDREENPTRGSKASEELGLQGEGDTTAQAPASSSIFYLLIYV